MGRLCLIAAAAVVCWAMFVAGFWVGVAASMTGQQLADDLARCVGSSVGAPPMLRTLAPLPPQAARADGLTLVGQVSSDRPDEAVIYPQLLWSFDRAAAGRPRGPFTADAVSTVLHELVHRAPVVGWRFDPFLEEGITEAITMDLLPVCTKATLGQPIYAWEANGAYQDEVAYIRRQSALATRSGWTSRAARLWRRAFYLADRDARRAMIPTPPNGAPQ